MNYNNIRGQIKTGDLIAFSGSGLVSELIKWKTKSDISHVAIVLETQYLKGEKRIILLESTTLNNLPDLKTGEFIKGVQQQLLSKRINTYNGQCYWCGLNVDLSGDKKQYMVNWLTKTHSKKTKYDNVQALGSALDLFDKLGLANKPDFSNLFCSELVAKAYKKAGLFFGNPSEQTPADVLKLPFIKEKILIS